MKTKKIWNVGKCIANISLLLFFIQGIILIVLFFGSPIIYQHIKFEVEQYVTYMTYGTIVGISLLLISIIARLSMIKVELKK